MSLKQYETNQFAIKRDNMNIFFNIVSDIHEFKQTMDEIIALLDGQKYVNIRKLNEYKKLYSIVNEINNMKLYVQLRNNFGFHNGSASCYIKGLDNLNGKALILAESSDNKNNNMVFLTPDLILSGLG